MARLNMLGSRAAQAARVALLAAEGLFLLRIAGIDEDGEWSAFLDDVESVFERLLAADAATLPST